jgi:hypothetical protein
MQALANDQTPPTIQNKCVTNISGQTAFPGLLSLAKNLRQQQQNNVKRSQPTMMVMMMMIIAHMAKVFYHKRTTCILEVKNPCIRRKLTPLQMRHRRLPPPRSCGAI